MPTTLVGFRTYFLAYLYALGVVAGLLIASLAIASLAIGAAPAAAVDTDQPLDSADAEIPWQWIGTRANTSIACPAAAGWSASALFEQYDGSTIPPTLAPYCLYRGNPAAIGNLLSLVLVSGTLTAVEPDTMAVAGLGSSLETDIWQDLANLFLDQAGDGVWPSHGGSRPRLTVLDTSPDYDIDPGGYITNSPHGYTLVNMAEQLLEDAGGLPIAEVHTRLALAYLDFDPSDRMASERDEDEGGVIGTIAELARAVRRETRSWETSPSGGHHVLNLSLGWNSLFGGDEPSVLDMPLPVQAVYEALRHASCRGGLIIAAAGNTTAGPDLDSGPVYPAAWEQKHAPAFTTCNLILGEVPDGSLFPAPTDTPYRPLVYAVGGIDVDGDRLIVSRPGAEARLAAFGDHATVGNETGGASTGVLTGTSVSALVVSAATAAVAYYRPDLRPYEIMATIYDAGDDLSRSPDFCAGGSPCPDSSLTVRRASVCGALTHACLDDTLGACPSSGSLPTCAAWPSYPSLDASDLVTFSATSTVDVDADVIYPFTLPTVCRTTSLLETLTPPVIDPCPQDQYYGVELETWVSPQPRSNPCTTCWGQNQESESSILYIEIDADWQGLLTDATLIIGTDSYNLGLGTLQAEDTAQVVNAPALPTDGTEVSIVFAAGKASVTAPVLVADSGSSGE